MTIKNYRDLRVWQSGMDLLVMEITSFIYVGKTKLITKVFTQLPQFLPDNRDRLAYL